MTRERHNPLMRADAPIDDDIEDEEDALPPRPPT